MELDENKSGLFVETAIARLERPGGENKISARGSAPKQDTPPALVASDQPPTPEDKHNETAAWNSFNSNATAVQSLSQRQKPKQRSRGCRRWRLVSGTMPLFARWVEGIPVVCFLDSCLRGLSQVLFLNNPITGTSVLAAGVVCDWYLCAYGVLGVVVSTGTAVLIGVDNGSIRGGLMGYNGWLTGVAMSLFQYGSKEAIQGPFAVYVAFAAACSSLFQVSLGSLMVPSTGIPPLTLPFHLATWICLLAAQSASSVPNADNTLTPGLVTPTSWAARGDVYNELDLVEGFAGVLKGVGQVFLLENTWSGAILVLGAAVSSPITAAAALTGSALGSSAALGLGVPIEAIERGLFGYNASVVAAALGGMFTILSWSCAITVVFACVFSSVLTASIGNVLAPCGMPALTFPAAFTVILFLLVTKSVSNGLIVVELAYMTVPEDHLERLQLSKLVRDRLPEWAGHELKESSDYFVEMERTVVPMLLCQASASGNRDLLSKLLQTGADASSADYDGRTALHLAAAEGHTDLVLLLLEHDANPLATDRWGHTPLWDACWGCTGEISSILLQHPGCTLGQSDLETGRRLCVHAAAGNIEKLASFLESGCAVNTSDFDKRTALHLAASEGQLATVEFLLDVEELQVNLVDGYGFTPLDDALRHSNHNSAALLIRRGACEGKTLSPWRGSASDTANDTATRCVFFALINWQRKVRKARVEIMATKLKRVNAQSPAAVRKKLSEESLPDIDIDSTMIGHMLGCAAKDNDVKQIKRLLKDAHTRNAVDAIDYDGRTALHVAASEGHVEAIQALLEANAAINPKDRWGHTPINDACQMTHSTCVQLLRDFGGLLLLDSVDLASVLCLEAAANSTHALSVWLASGCNPNACDYDGQTALHAASVEGSVSATLLLLQGGANPEVTNRWGQTPHNIAQSFGHHQTCVALDSFSPSDGQASPTARSPTYAGVANMFATQLTEHRAVRSVRLNF